MSLHCVFYPWQLFKELNPESCCRAPVQNVPHITSYAQQKTKSLELIKLIKLRTQILPHCLWLPLAHPWELCRAHKCPSPSPDRLSWLDNFKNLTLKSSLKIQSLSLASKLAIEPRVRRTCSAVPKGVEGAWFQYFDLNFSCTPFHQFQTCRPKGFLNFAIMLTSATAERMAASSSGEGVNACGYLFGQSFFGWLQMDMITFHNFYEM